MVSLRWWMRQRTKALIQVLPTGNYFGCSAQEK
jgi:hypothetical protein